MKNEARSEVKPFVYVAVGVAAIGGLLFGYDTGVISVSYTHLDVYKRQTSDGTHRTREARSSFYICT